MKKIMVFLTLLCLTLCGLCGCDSVKEPEKPAGDIDIDLSAFNATMAFAQASDMYAGPWNCIGKTVRVKGMLGAYTDETGKEHSLAMLLDTAACCAQGIEFVWKSDGGYAGEYPGLGEAVIASGRFELYQADEYSLIRLVDADVEWNRL